MTVTRDWLHTLWPGSYKGLAFEFESETEAGGRGIVIHEFPHRDDPFLEDMGEAPRYHKGTIYVHGESADRAADALSDMLASGGVGTLVVPSRGAVQVRCQEFERKYERDKLGYFAFEAKFIRDGAASAVISLPFTLRQAFVAADTLATAIATNFGATVALDGQPDVAVQAAIDGIQVSAATLDATRTTAQVDPAVSATLRDTLAGIIDAAPDALVRSDASLSDTTALAQSLIDATRSLADGMPPATAQSAMSDVGDVATFSAPPYLAPSDQAIAENMAAALRVARLAALTAWAEAVLRGTFPSRPDGVTARAEATARFDVELNNCQGAADAALYVAMLALRGRVVAYLTHLIADLAPVVTVTTRRILPSLWLAYRLYSDPLRSTELVARNQVRHPSFMPIEIQALAN